MQTIENLQRQMISAPGHRLPIGKAFALFQDFLLPSELSTFTQNDFIELLRKSGEVVARVEGRLYIANRLLPRGIYVDCGGALKLV